MTHSVEARVPFLDYRLVEFALGLPDEWKISRGVTKVILREGLRDSLPELVRNRMDKIGFATPEELWLKGEGADWFRNRVSDSVDGSSGIVRSSVMDELEQMISGRIPFSFKPWRIAAFGSWMRRFRVSA